MFLKDLLEDIYPEALPEKFKSLKIALLKGLLDILGTVGLGSLQSNEKAAWLYFS